MEELKFKLLTDKAVAPKYATDGSAAFDLTITKVDERLAYAVYHFDLAFEIPRGHVGVLVPRSSVSNRGQLLANSVGIIDSDYRGEVTARFVRTQDYVPYKVGERAVQMLIIKLPHLKLTEVTQLGLTDRGAGGYGSTGN